MKTYTVIETFQDGIQKTYAILATSIEEARKIIIKSLRGGGPLDVEIKEEQNNGLNEPEEGLEDYLPEDYEGDED